VLVCMSLSAGALAVPSGAQAIAMQTQITSPGENTYLLIEAGSKLTVSGTAFGVSEVDIRCYYGNGSFEFRHIAVNVPVTSEKFETSATLYESSAERLAMFAGLCQLRAVKSGETPPNLGPGEVSEAATVYKGPVVISSASLTQPANYEAYGASASASMLIEGAGGYALESYIHSTVTHSTRSLLFGDGALRYADQANERASLQVDGVDAYAPTATGELESKVGKIAGAPQVTAHSVFDPATHQFSEVLEEDPIVRCVPGGAYPPTSTSCKSFASAGVTLVRKWQVSNDNHLASMTDVWRSTDGAGHSVNARYYTELFNGKTTSGYRFPGSASFEQVATKQSMPLPAGSGEFLYKANKLTPDAGDGVSGQVAIAWDRAPSEAYVAKGADGEETVLELPYTEAVPAGGVSKTLRMAFAQGFALSEPLSLTEGALASYHPGVAISSPANSATVTSATPAVTVTGIVSDASPATVSVNGVAATLGAGGTWSATVPLALGANTITAVATDEAGLQGSAAVSVTYAKPVVPAPPAAKAAQVGTAGGAGGVITLSLSCQGAVGQSCKVKISASVLEHLLGKRITGVSARARKHTTRLTVAATTVTIAAGTHVTLKLSLNATGRRLLARFHKLPVHLLAIQSEPAPATTLVAQNLLVKPAKPKHKAKHHH
jgi:hypothetical protein